MKNLRFQKRIRLPGGVRLNVSKSGVGVSVGGPGMRAGVDAKGRKYTSVGIPGTGLSMRQYHEDQAPGGGGGGRGGSVLLSVIVVFFFVAGAVAFLFR